jgi:hypothetical protein
VTPFRVSVVAALAALVLLVIILELIRSRRLQERYAVLWLITAVTMLVLAVWREGLAKIADLAGIAYPPSALFVLVSLFILAVLLHYSTPDYRIRTRSSLSDSPCSSGTSRRPSARPRSTNRKSRESYRPLVSQARCSGVVNASNPFPIKRRSCHASTRRSAWTRRRSANTAGRRRIAWSLARQTTCACPRSE